MSLHRKAGEPRECIVHKLPSSGNQTQRCELHMDARAMPVANSLLKRKASTLFYPSPRNVHRNQQQSTMAILFAFACIKPWDILSEWYFCKVNRLKKKLEKGKM